MSSHRRSSCTAPTADGSDSGAPSAKRGATASSSQPIIANNNKGPSNNQQPRTNSIIETPQTSGIVEHLTCAMCLQLYDNPKNMPSCPHMFCAKCLQALPTATANNNNLLVIQCPQCRKVSPLGRNGVAAFQTNVAVKGAVEAILTQQKQELIATRTDEKDVCHHIVVNENQRLTCSHCDRHFCQVCQFVHMERLKCEITEAAGPLIKNCEEMSATNTLTALETVIDSAVKAAELNLETTVDTLRAVLESAFSSKVASLKQTFQLFKSQSLEIQKETIGHLIDRANIETLKQRNAEVGSRSVLAQQLDEVATFHRAVKEREEAVVALNATIAPCAASPILQFEANPELQKVLESIESVDIGLMKVNEFNMLVERNFTALREEEEDDDDDEACSSSSEKQCSETSDGSSDDNEEGTEGPIREHQQESSSAPEPLAAAGGSSEEAEAEVRPSTTETEAGSTSSSSEQPSTDATSPRPPSVPINEAPPKTNRTFRDLVDVRKITALPFKNFFIVLQGNDELAFLDRIGKVLNEFKVVLKKPHETGKQTLTIEDITCSDRDTVFYSYRIKIAAENKSTKSIGRLFVKDSGAVTFDPDLVVSQQVDAIHGMAVVDDWKTMFTTEGENVVAYTPISSRDEEVAEASSTGKFDVCQLGQHCHVFGVLDVGTTNTALLLCSSSDDNLVELEITRTPKNKIKKFRAEKQQVRATDTVLSVRNDSVFVLTGWSKVFVADGSSRVQVFGTASAGDDDERPVRSLNSIEVPASTGCKGVAVLRSWSPDNTLFFTVAARTNANTIELFAVVSQ